MVQDVPRDAPKDQPTEPCAPVGADDHEVGIVRVRGSDDLLGWIPVSALG